MILWLAIHRFAIASELELELGPGFTAITGETGSGKSLLVQALGILLGGRAEQGLIQQGMEQAEVRGGFSLDSHSPIMAWLVARDLQGDGELILRRIIRRDRAGRNYINGHPVNRSQLRELGDQLMDIHGQREHHSLLQKSVQQALLDEAAENMDLLQQLATTWDERREIDRALERIHQEQAGRLERTQLLQFQLGELELLNPGEDEWESLSQQQKRLRHAAELMQFMGSAVAQLYDADQSIQEQLGRVSERMRHFESYEPAFHDIAAMLEEAEVNVNEAVSRLRTCLDQTDADIDDLPQVEERLSTLHALSRKYQVAPDRLAAHRVTLQQTLAQLKNSQGAREALDTRKAVLEQACHELADTISANRHKVASTLSQNITAAIQELGMAQGQFEIRLEPVSPGTLSRSGRESVLFQVSTNPGQDLQPLHRIASGGEISRISLAIQVILAHAAKVPTLIFDEVDVGVGGTVANVVGQRLRELGESHQVIGVTHLPQVASRANRHFCVTKQDSSRSVTVEFNLLDRPARIAEIARMSGSDSPSQAAIDHSAQMLDSGNPVKPKG